MNNLIVAIDGNINTGKTTLIDRLKKSGRNDWIYVEEYEVVDCDNLWNRQLKYLEQDKIRTLSIDKKIVLDRSVLSLFGYVYWMYLYNKEDIRYDFYRKVVNLVSDGEIVLPNVLVYCHQEHSSIYQEFMKNYKSKGTCELLASEIYCNTINYFFERIDEILKGKMIRYNYRNSELIHIDQTNRFNTHDLLLAIIYALELDTSQLCISVNGTSSIGKTTLCHMFAEKGFKIEKEIRFVNDSNNEKSVLEHQINFFQKSIKRYEEKSMKIVDNGFLETISFTFFLASHYKFGEGFLDGYLTIIKREIPDKLYINQVIYLTLGDQELAERKELDNSKKREHFNTNSIFRKSEFCFFQHINELVNKHFVIWLDAKKTPEELYQDFVCKLNFTTISVSDLLRKIENDKSKILEYYQL